MNGEEIIDQFLLFLHLKLTLRIEASVTSLQFDVFPLLQINKTRRVIHLSILSLDILNLNLDKENRRSYQWSNNPILGQLFTGLPLFTFSFTLTIHFELPTFCPQLCVPCPVMCWSIKDEVSANWAISGWLMLERRPVLCESRVSSHVHSPVLSWGWLLDCDLSIWISTAKAH